MSQTPSIPPYVNQAMKLVLRSPVHGMVSKSVLLITFTGRKSGKTYTTPVSYSQTGDQIYIFTHAGWWKNLLSSAPVTLRIQGRDLQGLVEPVAEDKGAVAAGLSQHLREVPSNARYYGVTFDDHGNPRAEEVEQAAQTAVMIRIRLKNLDFRYFLSHAGTGRQDLKMVRKILLICGILASLVWMGTDILAALRYEGYNYPFDPISGLSATGAPTRSFVIPLDNLFVVLKIAFAWGVWLTADQKRALRITAGLLFASGVVDLAAYFFPWNPGEAVGTLTNMMHAILAGGVTVLLILLTIGFGARADGKWFRFYSYGTLLILIVSGALMSLGDPRIEANEPPLWFGLAERIDAYGFMLWMIVLVILLLRTQPESLSREAREGIVHPGAAANRV